VVVALLLLGGEALRGFSEALLIGIIAARTRRSGSRAPSRCRAASRPSTSSRRCAKTRSTDAVAGVVRMAELLTDPHAWIAFLTLSALEIVLGIDNIIFISILVSRLPPERREAARITGLALAMLTRIALLFSIVWLTRLTKPLVTCRSRQRILRPRHHPVVRRPVPARQERHRDPRDPRRCGDERHTRVFANFRSSWCRSPIIDIVFSLDSVFTAVGLAKPDQLPIMVAAIVLAILRDDVGVRHDQRLHRAHPTIKILALAFLILVGVVLVADSFHFDVPRVTCTSPWRSRWASRW
jgi:predicted tellurium resistance membrane protein TerC